MKKIFLISYCLLVFTNTVLCSDTCMCCSDKKITSPVAPKPTDSVVNLTCTRLVLKWKGQTDQNFEVTVVEKNGTTNKVIDTLTTTSISYDGTYYSASFTTKEGRIINWYVEAISTINSRTFYSYPLRGNHDYAVPACSSAPVAAAGKTKADVIKVSGDNNTIVRIYPNPVQSVLNIEFSSSAILSKGTVLSIVVFDVTGKALIRQQTITKVTQVNVKSLVAGTYFIRIEDNSGRILFNGKVIKE